MILEETFEAVVTNNQDELQLGRIQVVCQALMGSEEEPVPMWIKPIAQWGWFVIPDVGEQVEIAVVSGATDDESFGQSSIGAPNLRWRGTRLWMGTEGASPRPVPNVFKANYGKRRGFMTPAGHVLWFDDTEDSEQVSLTWTNTKGDKAEITFTPAGAVEITDKTGNQVKLGDKIIIIAGTDDVTIQATKAIVDADTIELGGSAHKAVFGDMLKTAFDSHTHPVTAVGSPTGPPAVPLTGHESNKVSLG